MSSSKIMIKPTVLQLTEALARGSHLSTAERLEIHQFVRRMMAPVSSFQIGSLVEKRAGYRFPGEIRSIFATRRGEIRVVAEADHSEFEGMLHIYMPEQLRKVVR